MKSGFGTSWFGSMIWILSSYSFLKIALSLRYSHSGPLRQYPSEEYQKSGVQIMKLILYKIFDNASLFSSSVLVVSPFDFGWL